MGYAEKLGKGTGTYYRARFKQPDGRYGTVKDGTGANIRFKSKRAAEAAANDKEAEVRGGKWRDPRAGQMLFGEWCERWLAGLDLAGSTMSNYRRRIEEHLLPEFAHRPLADILSTDVDQWEKKRRAAGYADSSIKTWRTTLGTILADAVDEGLIEVNPTIKRRGRGKRNGRSAHRGPERVIVGPLEALLIAERSAVLSGRADEFVAVIMTYYTGLRWGELAGFETKYVRPSSIRIEWQLWEDDKGIFHRIPPKEDSYRDIDAPPFLTDLLAAHLAQTTPQPCSCHGLTYVFSGQRSKSAHWRRSSFSDWVFDPAVSGWYPSRGRTMPPRPVSVTADPWPGAVLRGRNNAGRADVCWTPIAKGLTPHGLRHSHKTLLVEMRVPEILSHERLGHELGGIGGRYSHVTPAMRQELADGLTERWNEALDERAALNPSSSIPILDELLQARKGDEFGDETKIVSKLSPKRPVLAS